jgi:hypothetical protein
MGEAALTVLLHTIHYLHSTPNKGEGFVFFTIFSSGVGVVASVVP